MKKNYYQLQKLKRKWLTLWLLLIMPIWGFAQSNTVTITWNSQVGCITYGSEIEDPKDHTQPVNGAIYEQLLPGQTCQKVCEYSTVKYTATGNNISSVTWSITGGTIVSTSGANNSIANVDWGPHGNGSLSTTVTYSDGSQQTSTLCVEITNSPVAQFEMALGQETTVCLGTQVFFDNQSHTNGGSAIVHYNWHVSGPNGIDQVFSTAFEPSYTFTQQGTYTISLTVTNSCNCSSKTYHMEVTVEGGPPVDITCKSVTCEGSRETYTANNICGGEWQAIGGSIVSQNGNTVEIEWNNVDPADGFGYVSYTPECGCKQKTIIKVPVVLKEGKIQGNEGICVGQQSLYKLPQWPTTNFLWGISGGPAGGAQLTYTANRNEVYVTGLLPGTYTLSSTYYNTLLGCDGHAEFIIKVEEPVEILGGNNEVCTGTAQTYTSSPSIPVSWTITHNNSVVATATGTTINYNFPTSGTYIVTATKPGGCASEPRVITAVQLPGAPTGNISGETKVCAGVPYTYTLSSVDPGMLPVWSVTGGNIQGSNTGQSITVLFNSSATNYTVTVKNMTSDQLGCTSLTGVDLAVSKIDLNAIDVIFPPGVPNAPNPTYCPSGTYTFTTNMAALNIVPDSMEWSFVNPANGATLPNFGSLLPTANGVNVQFNEISGNNNHAILRLKIIKCGQEQIIDKDIYLMTTPTVNFTPISTICFPTTINFQLNQSMYDPGATVTFTFNNNNTSYSTSMSPTGQYSFPNNGYIVNNNTNLNSTITQSVTVKITYGICNGFVATANSSFGVYPEIKINITPGYNYSICNPANYQPVTLYSDVSTGVSSIQSYQWYLNSTSNPIPGQNTSSLTISGANPFGNPSPYGNYFLGVTATNGCTSFSSMITVDNANCTPGCTPPAGINPVVVTNWNGCNTATATLQGIGTPTSITWLASPLMTVTGGQGSTTATFSTNVAGAHTATAVLNYNGCKVSVSGTIIKRYEPKLSVEVICTTGQSTYNVVVKNNSSVFDINPATINYTYSLQGSGLQYSGVNMQSATFTGLTAGTYTFVIKLEQGNNPPCIKTMDVVLHPVPDVAFANPGTQFCAGEPITLTIPGYNPANTYSWNFAGTSYIPTGATSQITINSVATSLPITLHATSPYGCHYSFSRLINVSKANFDGTLEPSSINICSGSNIPSIVYDPGSLGFPQSFTWMNGSNPVTGAPTTGSFTPTQSGSYWAVLTAANGCKDYVLANNPVEVIIKSKPYVNISGNANLCAGGSTVLTGLVTIPNISHQWEDLNGNVLQAWNTNSPITYNTGVLAAGTYTYRLRVDDSGCTNYKDFTITVSNPPAAPAITYNIDQCQPYLVTLTASGPSNGTYLWSNGMMGQSIQVGYGGAYGVTYIAPGGCTASATEMIPHSLESLMWIFPTGCFERCPRDQGFIIGPLGVYDYSWLHNGLPIVSGNGLIDPLLMPNQPGTYQLQLTQGQCTFTSGTMNVSPNPENCEVGDCKVDGYVKEIVGGNPYYMLFGMLYNYGNTAVTFTITSSGNNGTFVPATNITVPPYQNGQPGVYDFTTNPLLFYPAPGFQGGSDDILFQGISCEIKIPVEYSEPKDTSKSAPKAAPKATPKVNTEVFTMSPNPAREQVRIQYNTGNEKNAAKLLIIHDAAGNVRYRKELSSYEGEITVPLNGWLQGVYIVNIVTGDKALQGKLLKE